MNIHIEDRIIRGRGLFDHSDGAVLRIPDFQNIILHLAVGSLAGITQTAFRTESETGIGLTLHGPGRYVDCEGVYTCKNAFIGDHMVFGIPPTIISVEINPAVDHTGRRCDHRHCHRLPGCNKG